MMDNLLFYWGRGRDVDGFNWGVLPLKCKNVKM